MCGYFIWNMEQVLHNYYSRSKQVIYYGNITRDAEAEVVKNIRYRFRFQQNWKALLPFLLPAKWKALIPLPLPLLAKWKALLPLPLPPRQKRSASTSASAASASASTSLIEKEFVFLIFIRVKSSYFWESSRGFILIWSNSQKLQQYPH